jgi:hypothetical protein
VRRVLNHNAGDDGSPRFVRQEVATVGVGEETREGKSGNVSAKHHKRTAPARHLRVPDAISATSLKSSKTVATTFRSSSRIRLQRAYLRQPVGESDGEDHF